MGPHRRDEGPGAPEPVLLRVFAPDSKSGADVEHIMLSEAGSARALIACSTALRQIIAKARQVARCKVPVLIQGESGTGKELIARLIHESSPRHGRPFIQVNCASFSETLVASELFGHEKGAFTGADRQHHGYFERAAGGSLLLDEIGEMPLKLQAKLLRVLEEERFDRVGGEEPLTVDTRLIATTNRDLEAETAQGQFRGDLYYRLSALPLHLPALRTRPEDIAPLVDYFISKHGDQGADQVRTISGSALRRLVAYSWPGNVRQLRNVIQHACVVARADCIEVDDLPLLRESTAALAPTASQRSLAEIERQLILSTLREVGGNRMAAAMRLGITVRTLQNKLKKYRNEAA